MMKIEFDPRLDLIADVDGIRHAASGTGTILSLLGSDTAGFLIRNVSVGKIDQAASDRVAELAQNNQANELRAYLKEQMTRLGRATECGWQS